MKNIFIFLFSFLITACLFDSNEKQAIEDEKQIYSTITDALFDSSYKVIILEDSSRSMNRYIIKNLFSKTLFGKGVEEYYTSFFKEKDCTVAENLIEDFIERNLINIYLPDNFSPAREHKFISYRAIYYFIYGYVSRKHPLFEISNNDTKFGIISFSRAGFYNDNSEALMEVNISRKKKGEIFFISLKKVNDVWHIDSHCYMYGPYKID